MAAPINTYNSDVDLGLGQVPQVDDPKLYQSLLDIHNAIEALATYVDDSNADLVAFLNKFRSAKSIPAGNYDIQPQDGTLLVDASSGSVTLTLPPSESYKGYRYNIKVIGWSYPYEVIVVGSVVGGSPELIDDHPNGVKVSYLSSYTFVSKNTDTSPLLTGYTII